MFFMSIYSLTFDKLNQALTSRNEQKETPDRAA